MLVAVAFIIALFFAMNIGASGTAASMGPAYGSGAITKKRMAMLLVSIFALLGALSGGEVVRTIGKGIIPEGVLDVEIVIIVLASACLTLFIANLLGIPLSTSEVVVGAIVGAGIAYQALLFDQLLIIVAFWMITPFTAFLIGLVLGKWIRYAENRWTELTAPGKWRRPLAFLLVAAGCMEAYAAGMNNVANAVGPLVGVGLLDVTTAVLLGGIFVSLGAVLLGGRVLETNGKKITQLSLLQGSAVSLTGGSLVITASIFGLPVPLTQITTSAIVGIGTADKGFQMWQQRIVKQIIKVWIVSPVTSLILSYGLILLFKTTDYYTLFVIIAVFIATAGVYSLYLSTRAERGSTYDEGGGI
ncbi:inorganic phosphate transporter [Oceanobacillus sp. CFH 90083]|uniref:inorganic phosphate transporter n=1 Tax=Oceanobacillus sp. CFH 90083 TaxID=2592336 RepID=UPI00128BEAB5|nr:inorganic phosphate transporter [Oceanobacillus sp. CFH 90083]